MEHVSDRIRELRIEKSITQKELANVLNTTDDSVFSWEKGRCLPSYEAILKLAEFFNVSTDYLLGRTDDLGAVVVPGGAVQLSADEQEILSLYAELSPSRKEDLRIYLRALSGAGAVSEKKKA